MRPGSASRGQAGIRPGTGQPTALLRPGTGGMSAPAMRLGTGMMGAAGFSSAVDGGLSVSERPATQMQGMSGAGPARIGTAGSGRQVQDASYFAGALRSRINEVSAEVARLRAETDKAAKDAVLSAQLDRRYEAAIKEVRALEGDLADYNLAMDKSRTSMDASEIVAYYTNLKRRNEAASREIDAVFMERQERERGAARLEEQIRETQKVAEARLNSLPPQQLAEYRSLVEENRNLGGTIGSMQNELEGLNAAIEQAEAEVRRDRIRDEYTLMEKRLAHLKRERASLEEEAGAARLDPAAAREKLLARVKEDNARIQALDKQVRQMEDEAAQKKKTLADVAAELEERRAGGMAADSGGGGDAAKYEVLFKRDQEMTEFIDRFDDFKEKELTEQRRSQSHIVALLEHISEGLERAKNLPSREAAEEAKEDLSDKARELKASEMTAERLGAELQRRQAELEKVSTLDTKIGAELTSLQEKMATMKADMLRFADIEGLKVAVAATKDQLETKVAEYTRRRDALRAQVAPLAAEYDARRTALARDPHHAALDALETKLRNYEQTIFGLREFIATKGKETDFEGVRAECMRLVAEINALVQAAQR